MERSTSWTQAVHFRDEEWADLARIQTDERRTRLQQHLDEGCEDCERRLRFWTAVSRAMREGGYDTPAPAVRQVRGHFAMHRPRSFLKRAVASLVFDSAREPLPLGVRAGVSSARQLVYAKFGRLVKLSVESQDGSQSLSLVGQVVEERAPQRTLPNLPVLAQSGRKTVNQTLTNESGEFTMDLAPAQRLRLVLGMPGSAIVVVLPVTAAVH
jgi:hypothetical protein